MLHRTDRVAVNLGNSFRIFKESEQTVAVAERSIFIESLIVYELRAR
jgi:hypothetical protein